MELRQFLLYPEGIEVSMPKTNDKRRNHTKSNRHHRGQIRC